MNMTNEFIRSEMLFGKSNIEKLKEKRIAIFGIGGVGSYVLEALVRMGIENIDIIDNDVVSVSNINRQLIALHSTLGEYKTDVAYKRCKDINENCNIRCYKQFYLNNDDNTFDFAKYDYVIDAIDTVAGKIQIIEAAKAADVPVISAMGAGNKLDPSAFKVADISRTSVCPLAKVMRRELRRRGISHVKVVYSEEEPIKPEYDEDAEIKGTGGRPAPGSIAFVPSAAGLVLAGEVIKDLALGIRD